MNNRSRKQMFTSELRRKKEQGIEVVVAAAAESVAQARHEEIMETLNTILRNSPGDTEISGSVVEDFKREVHESAEVKHELKILSKAIYETKMEIASLRHPGADNSNDRLITMGHQLDAVVEATEQATETILAAAEVIDDNATSLKVQASGEHEIAQIEEIGDQVTRIFEACNFQDITGQRITKVVNTLKFIEDRVIKMMDILGGSEAFADVDISEEADQSEDDKLLNGPQLNHEQRIDQDAIDKLFD